MTYTKTILPQNEGENTQNNDKSKYEKALELYETNLNDAEVQATVKQIIEEKVPQNDTLDVKKFLFGSIELTTLSTTDTEEKVLRMVEMVNRFDREYPDIPHVAAVCVYPVFTELVSKSLEVDGVEITNVCGNFPSSQARMEVKVAETQLAVADGATEIDIVLPVGKFLSGDYEGVCDDISEMKQACGAAPMKVILETGDLETASNIVALLRDITQSGTAVVMSTHNPSMLSKYPGIVYRCADGRMKEITDEYSKIDLSEDEE